MEWASLAAMSVAVLVFAVTCIGGVVGLGLLLSVVLRRPGLALPGAIATTLLLTAVALVYQVLYELGGRPYDRYGLWIGGSWTVLSLAWLVGLGYAINTAGEEWSGRRVQTFGPLAVYGIGAVAFWALWSVPGSLSTHGDGVMIRHFQRHEAEFARLAGLATQESPTFAYCGPGKVAGATLPDERSAEYAALLGAVNVQHGIMRERRGEILLRYWTMTEGGYFGQNVEKGYAVLPEPPERPMDSLDDGRWNGQGLVYRHLEGSWYLYYFNRDSLRAICDLG